MSKKFSIKINDFEGPFYVLLEIIQKKKLSINDVSLASITDEYISFLKENEMSLRDTTYFIWTAATLMLLKSKSLLPKLSLGKDEEDDIDELKSRLSFLREIRKYSSSIKEIFGKNILYKKKYKKKTEIRFRPDEGITPKNILISLDRLLIRSTLLEKKPEVKVEKVKSLKEVIGEVKNKINRLLRLSFSELHSGKNKKEIAVSFLAVLELFRNNNIDLEQNEDFGEIIILKK